MANFVKEFFKHPKMVWTFLPCYSTLVDKVLSNIDFANDLEILELWPWKWNFLSKILLKSSKNSSITSVELNKWFYDYLTDNFIDNRLKLINDDAVNFSLKTDKKFDVIVSWIPLSALDEKTRLNILHNISSLLKDWWIFIQYQYFSSARSSIELIFKNVSFNRVVFHIPPAVYFLCSN